MKQISWYHFDVVSQVEKSILMPKLQYLDKWKYHIGLFDDFKKLNLLLLVT